MEKKGYFFSIDAIIASTLLITGLLLASTLYVKEPDTTTIERYSQDLMNVLSKAKLHEFNSSLINDLIVSGQIDDLNKTILEQAAQFWAEGNASLATTLLKVTEDIIPEQFKVGIYFGNEYIYGQNDSPTLALVSSKRLLSGFAKGKPVEGFTSAAQLTSFEARSGFAYYYFGGFVGQGNLTVRIVLPATVVNITSAYLEADINDNFTLYVNNNFAGDFSPGSAGGGYKLADKWQINDSYLDHFTQGANFVNLTFDTYGFVGGGFLRVGYLTAEANDTNITSFEGTVRHRYYFPRINGLINLFDSFFIPGQLEKMFIHLHYDSNVDTFLTIGNVTVWTLDSIGENFVDLPNSDLKLKLDYTASSEVTIPIRFGATVGGNITTEGFAGKADVILVNDLSGSMEYCINSGCSASQLGNKDYCTSGHVYKPENGTYCELREENFTDPIAGPVCQDRWHAFCPANDTRKIDILINASGAFSDLLLGALGNKLGMIGYSSDRPLDRAIPAGGVWADRFTLFPDSIVSAINLSDNTTALNNYINTRMDTYFETCICCGVNRAIQIFNNLSNENRFKAMVVMSDGEATDKCGGGYGIGAAKAKAIEKALEACNDYNISVSTVAFGQDADTETLQDMVCGGGDFYNASDVEDLISVYSDLAKSINNFSYSSQLINVSGGTPAVGLLFGDSYIEYNYTPGIIPGFALIPATLESPRFGNNISETTLDILAGMNLTEIRVTSYSDTSWTDNLTISNSIPNRNAFTLDNIASDYLAVGDPFVVYANPTLFETGSNLVHISTGSGPTNYTGGSNDNVIVYKLLVPNFVPEQGVFLKADGCVWQVTFEDGSNTTLTVPSSYSGSEVCIFNPPTFPSNDALDDAVFRLLSLLDFDDDGLLDVTFGEDGLGISLFTISDVPSLWGPTVVEVRVWQ